MLAVDDQVRGGIALRILEIAGKDTLDFSERRDGVELLPQLGAAVQPLGVPAEVLAELDGGTARIGLVRHHFPRVIERDSEALRDRRSWPLRPAGHEIFHLVEDPGLTVRAASDHDPGAARLLAHA